MMRFGISNRAKWGNSADFCYLRQNRPANFAVLEARTDGYFD